jgi:hypothetical protein
MTPVLLAAGAVVLVLVGGVVALALFGQRTGAHLGYRYLSGATPTVTTVAAPTPSTAVPTLPHSTPAPAPTPALPAGGDTLQELSETERAAVGLAMIQAAQDADAGTETPTARLRRVGLALLSGAPPTPTTAVPTSAPPPRLGSEWGTPTVRGGHGPHTHTGR